MESEKWNFVLIEWVNCLKLDKHIDDVQELRSGVFFINLQKILTRTRDLLQVDVLTFIFDLLNKHYPNYSIEDKAEIHLSDVPVVDLKAIISLLLHYTCIHDRRDVLTSPLCYMLDQSTQLIIRTYLEKITRSVNNNSLNEIIRSCISPEPINLVCLTDEPVDVQSSPLQNLLKTPKIGRLHEKDKLISKLKSELETERYEKLEVQDELKLQLDKNQKIKEQLLQKTNEISKLRSEIVVLENRTPPHYQDMDSREVQRRLKAEIQSLELYLRKTEIEYEEMSKERDVAREQLKKLESQAGMWEAKYFEVEYNFEKISEFSKRQQEEFDDLRQHCNELTAMLEEYRSNPSDSNLLDTFTSLCETKNLNETDPPDNEDLACSVVEVQLRETQQQLKETEDELNVLRTKLTEQQTDIVEIDKKYLQAVAHLQEIQIDNNELQSKVTALQIKNDEKKIEIREVEERLADSKRQIEVLEFELTEEKAMSNQLQFELADATLDNQKTSENLLSLRQASEELESRLLESYLVQHLTEEKVFEAEHITEQLKNEVKIFKEQFDETHSDLEGIKTQKQLIEKHLKEYVLMQTVLTAQFYERIKILEGKSDELDELHREHESIKNELIQTSLMLEASKRREEELTVVESKYGELLPEMEKMRLRVVDLKRDSQTQKEIIAEREKQLQTLEENLDAVTSQKLILEKRVDEKEAEQKASINHIRIVETKLNEAEEISEQLQSEVANMVLAIENVNKSLNAVKEVKVQLEQRVLEAENDKRVTETRLSQSEAEAEELKVQLQAIRLQLNETRVRYEKLTVDKDLVEKQLEEALNAQSVTKQQCQEVETSLKIKSVEISELNERLLKREDELAEVEEKHAKLLLEFEALQMRMVTLEKSKDELQKNKNVISEQNKKFELQIQTLQQELEDVSAQKMILKKRVDENVIEQEAAKQQINSLDHQLQELETKSKKLEFELRDTTLENHNTHERLKLLNEAKEQLEQQVFDAENEKHITEERLSEKEAEAEELKVQLQAIQLELNQTRVGCEKLTTDNELVEKQLEDALNAQSVIKQQFQEVEASLKNKSVEMSDLNESLLKREGELAEVEEKHAKLLLEFEALQMRMVTLEKSKDELQKNKNIMSEQNEKFELQIQTLQQELEGVTAQKVILKKRVDENVIEQEAAKQQINSLEHQLQELETKSKKFEFELRDATLENHNAHERLKSLNEAKEQLEQQVFDAENEKQITETRLSQMRAENERLKNQLETIQVQLNETSVEYEKLTTDKELAEKQLEDALNVQSVIKHQCQEFETILKNKLVEMDHLNERLLNGEEELAVVEAKYAKLLPEFDGMQSRIANLQKSKDELERNKEIIAEQNARLEVQIQTLLQELEDIASQKMVLQKRAIEHETAKKQIEKQLDETKAKSQKVELELASINSELLQSLDETKALQQKLSATELENKLMKNNLSVLLQKLDESKQREDELTAVEDKYAKLLLEFETMQLNVADLQKSKNEMECDGQTNKEAMEKLELEIRTLQEKLGNIKAQKFMLERDLEDGKHSSSQMLEKCKHLEEIVQDYEFTISGLKSVVDTNVGSLESLEFEIASIRSKESLAKREMMTLLKENDIIIDQGQLETDFATFASHCLGTMLKLKYIEEERRDDLECEIKELRRQQVYATKLKTSLQAFVTKLWMLSNCEEKTVNVDISQTNVDTIDCVLDTVLESINNTLNLSNVEKTESMHQLEIVKSQQNEVLKTNKLLESKLSEEKEKVEYLRRELESHCVKSDKENKENILGASTRHNQSKEDELKKENMLLKRKIVLAENSKNNLEKALKGLREEQASKQANTLDNDKSYKKLLHEYIELKEDFERAQKEVETVKRQSEELKQKTIRNEMNDDKRSTQELLNVREAYGKVVSINAALKQETQGLNKMIEQLNSEIINTGHIKEAYEKLLEENNKLLTDIDTIKYKRARDKEEFVRLLKKERDESSSRESRKIQEVRGEYESKLEKMKEKMLKLYREEVHKKVKPVRNVNNDEFAHFEKIVADLRMQLLDAGHKIKILEIERDALMVNKMVEHAVNNNKNVDAKSVSNVAVFTTTTTTTTTASSGRPSVVGPLMGSHNLQMEDEEDLFNEKYLTEMKEGKCTVTNDRDTTNRFSELAWRNSMVLPHLKSSYPAELQFVSPTRFKEEELKSGHLEFDDSLCKLLPGEKPRKKDFGTTSYKRPGPPTPSKNGGRLSLQGNEVHPIKEHSETKKSTPSRIRALFTSRAGSTLRDVSENSNGSTPTRGRRLNIFRRPR